PKRADGQMVEATCRMSRLKGQKMHVAHMSLVWAAAHGLRQQAPQGLTKNEFLQAVPPPLVLWHRENKFDDSPIRQRIALLNAEESSRTLLQFGKEGCPTRQGVTVANFFRQTGESSGTWIVLAQTFPEPCPMKKAARDPGKDWP